MKKNNERQEWIFDDITEEELDVFHKYALQFGKYMEAYDDEGNQFLPEKGTNFSWFYPQVFINYLLRKVIFGIEDAADKNWKDNPNINLLMPIYENRELHLDLRNLKYIGDTKDGYSYYISDYEYFNIDKETIKWIEEEQGVFCTETHKEAN